MSGKFVYMDNNATTPMHPEVKERIVESFNLYANPSSMHTMGRSVNSEIEASRKAIADFLNTGSENIIFTAGGSESNNAVLKSIGCNIKACKSCPASKNKIITTAIEHPSVLNTAKYMEDHGAVIKYLSVDSSGKINFNELESFLDEDTALVSVMFANNEIGTVQDIKKITEISHKYGVLVHTDAVQAIGKVSVDVEDLGVDFLSFSGHKIYGPKGIGVLYTRHKSSFCPFIHGGHQEHGMRAGTLNTSGILGVGKAVECIKAEFGSVNGRIWELRESLRKGIIDKIPNIRINGHEKDVLPNTLNVSFPGAEGESILLYLDLEGIEVSTGSACASGSLDPSHVLLATGLGPELAHGSIRFSLGRESTMQDVEYVLDKLPGVISRIRGMSSVSY